MSITVVGLPPFDPHLDAASWTEDDYIFKKGSDNRFHRVARRSKGVKLFVLLGVESGLDK